MEHDEHWIRKEEFGLISSLLPQKKFTFGLEIGAGDGCQSEALASLCTDFISTEYHAERMKKRNVKQMQADVQKLPFSNNQFDFVYSSNVLEHIPDLHKAFAELKRVSTPEAFHVHIMPSCWCKVSHVFFYYVKAFHILFSPKKLKKLKEEKNEKFSKKEKNTDNRYRKSLWQCIFPPIHGAASHHFNEFLSWRKKRWAKLFLHHDYEIKKIVKMPFYFSAGYDLPKLRKFLNTLGLTSSYA